MKSGRRRHAKSGPSIFDRGKILLPVRLDLSQVVTGDAPAAKAAALNSVFVKANAKVAASDEED